MYFSRINYIEKNCCSKHNLTEYVIKVRYDLSKEISGRNDNVDLCIRVEYISHAQICIPSSSHTGAGRNVRQLSRQGVTKNVWKLSTFVAGIEYAEATFLFHVFV